MLGLALLFVFIPFCNIYFICKIADKNGWKMLLFLIPNYVKEGKYRLVIAIGCTGGQHRSVTLANALHKNLVGNGEYGLTLTHRDAKK